MDPWFTFLLWRLQSECFYAEITLFKVALLSELASGAQRTQTILSYFMGSESYKVFG